MSEQKIEDVIVEVLTGDTQKNALEFVSFLRENKMPLEKGTGYWADKFYYMVKYNERYVCFILIGDSEIRGIAWTVWLDESDTGAGQWYENALPEKSVEMIAVKNIDFCGKCSPDSPCYGGIRKTVFGKEYENVCRTTFRFDFPDAETVHCMKKLTEIQKDYIIKLK